MMRRTPLKASAKPLQRRSPMNRTGILSVASYQLARRRAPRVKKAPASDALFRSEAYLAIVRKLACVKCGVSRFTEAAHSNQLRFGKGRGLKASDATAMALCKTRGCVVGCHPAHDQGRDATKFERWEFEYKHITLTVMELIDCGDLVGDCDVLQEIAQKVERETYESIALVCIGHIESGRLTVAR